MTTTRIFLIDPQSFYSEAISRLQNLGYEARLICAGPRRREHFANSFPAATVISTVEAESAALIGGEPRKPAHYSQISQLAPYSGSAYLMMDRKNDWKHRLSHLHRRYLDYIAFWSSLVESEQPDAVVFHGWPHMGYDFVLYWLCKTQGVAVRIIDSTAFDDRVRLLQSLEDVTGPSLADLEAYRRSDGESGDQEEADVTTLNSRAYESMNRSHNDLRAVRHELSLWGILRTIITRRMLRPLERLPDPMYGYGQVRRLQVQHLAKAFVGRARARRLLRLYRKLTSVPAAAEPYVYVPLHFQPESSTLPEGGLLYEQTHNVETLLSALPKGWRLYVREHPRQFRRSDWGDRWRDAGFYRRLVENPSVRLIPLETPTADLIRGARAVATVTGTTGWEAVRRGVPALVFGNPWYLTCPGVHAVRTSEDCAEVLASFASPESGVDGGDVACWARFMRGTYLIPATFSDQVLELTGRTPEENAEAYASAIDESLRSSVPAIEEPQRVKDFRALQDGSAV